VIAAHRVRILATGAYRAESDPDFPHLLLERVRAVNRLTELMPACATGADQGVLRGVPPDDGRSRIPQAPCPGDEFQRLYDQPGTKQTPGRFDVAYHAHPERFVRRPPLQGCCSRL